MIPRPVLKFLGQAINSCSVHALIPMPVFPCTDINNLQHNSESADLFNLNLKTFMIKLSIKTEALEQIRGYDPCLRVN